MIDSPEGWAQLGFLLAVGLLSFRKGIVVVSVYAALAGFWLLSMINQEIMGTNSPAMTGLLITAFICFCVTNTAWRHKVIWPLIVSCLLIASMVSDLVFFGYTEFIGAFESNRGYQDMGAALWYGMLLCVGIHSFRGRSVHVSKWSYS